MKKIFTILLLFFFSFFLNINNASATISCGPLITNPSDIDLSNIPLGSIFSLSIDCETNLPGATLSYSWSLPSLPNSSSVFLIASEPASVGVGVQVVELASGCVGYCDITTASVNITINPTACQVTDVQDNGVTCVDLSTLSLDGTPLNSFCGECSTGEPVNINTGSLWHGTTEFVVKGRTEATNIRFDRMYVANSATVPGDLGPNWRHNYETSLQFDYSAGANEKGKIVETKGSKTIFSVEKIKGDINKLIWIDENGGPWRFQENAGVYAGPQSLGAKLLAFADHFELKKKDGTTLFFSNGIANVPQFKLYQIMDRHGEILSLSYTNGKLESISSPFAGAIQFTRNQEGKIASIHRVRDNLSYTYTYNAKGRLESTVDFAGKTYSYSYVSEMPGTKAQGMLKTITDPLNRVLEFSYYPNGKAYQQFEAGGGVRTFVYGANFTKITDIDGFTTTHFFDNKFRTTKIITPDKIKHYNEWSNNRLPLKTSVEFGGITKYGYDVNGNVNSIQRPGDPNATQILYDQNFNKPIEITPLIGAPTSFTLDQNTGDLLGVSRGGLSLNFTRDSFGNLLSTNNGIFSYTNQRDANGLLTQVFDLHNPETRTHDSRGRILTRNFASGRVISYGYDDYDRVLTVTDSHGPNLTNTYDVMGRLLAKDEFSLGEHHITSYVYDDKDRLISVTDALNRTISFSYDPVRISREPIAVTDPAGRVTYFEYDKMHRLTKKTEANGAITKFTYDERGNLTSVVDANGDTTVYAYDLNNRRLTESHESVAGSTKKRKFTKYFYDFADRLVKKYTPSTTGGEGRAIIFEYDPLDRMVKRIIAREGAGNFVEDTATFSYENILDAKLLSTATNSVSTLGFTHEMAPPFLGTSFSNTATVSQNPLGLIEGIFNVARGITGEIISITGNSGPLFTKTYDPAGRLLEVSAGAFNTALSYDGFGRKSSVSHTDGTSGAFTYDQLNRTTNIAWSGGSLVNPVSEALNYDLAGNITNLAREHGSYTLAYDNVDQLVSSSSSGQNGFVPYNRNFTYDLLGNRLSDSVNGAGSFVSNFLTQNGVSNYQADPDGFGDLTTETSGAVTKSFGYRADGRLNSFSSSAVQANYYYDALGRRVAKTINKPSENFTQSYLHVLQADRILQAKAGDGSITTYLEGNGVDQHLGEVKGGVAKGYVTDHLGSVLNSDVAGASNQFGLFGEVNSAVAISQTSNPVMYGFTGREWDAESSTNYHRARNYQPETGRWLSQDPIGLARIGTIKPGSIIRITEHL